MKMWKLSIEVSQACSRWLVSRGLQSLAWDASKGTAAILAPTKAQPAGKPCRGPVQKSGTYGQATSPGQQVMDRPK